jgi:hypothetical protein
MAPLALEADGEGLLPPATADRIIEGLAGPSL